MADRIVLSGMQFFGFHGVLPEETRLGQPFLVDVDMALDLKPAGCSDDLRQTVDYAEVYALVREIVEGRPVKLIETLAERVAGSVLTTFPVQSVTVRVHKPNAPLPGPCGSVTVEISRGSGT